jgi:hypothetical protein
MSLKGKLLTFKLGESHLHLKNIECKPLFGYFYVTLEYQINNNISGGLLKLPS